MPTVPRDYRYDQGKDPGAPTWRLSLSFVPAGVVRLKTGVGRGYVPKLLLVKPKVLGSLSKATMADLGAVSNYFLNKIVAWSAASGSAEAYVRQAGRPRLAQEFADDPDFIVVCELAREIGELQLRSHIVTSIEGFVGTTFNSLVVGEMNIVIGAIMDACGEKTLGEKLVETGFASLFASLFLGALIFGAAAGAKKK